MSLLVKILIGWAAFDVIMYLWMWYDCYEHHHNMNIKKTFTDIKESFTQDE